jgi:hypothetical protein
MTYIKVDTVTVNMRPTNVIRPTDKIVLVYMFRYRDYCRYGNIIYVFWNRETLLKIIKNEIKTGTKIYSDQWRA